MKEERSQLDKETLLSLFFDSLHLTILHYGLWFRETEHQLGLDKAIKADSLAWQELLPATIGRLGQGLGFPQQSGVPQALANLSKEALVDLTEEMAKNWLACDGIWFQTIEKNYDYEMLTAKRINDTNWVRFSYIEAKIIMSRLGLPENGGLPALKEALKYRQYALVNQQEIVEAGDNKLIFRMIDCRVQAARKKRGLPDYPCKSAGIVEYSRFAEGIDARIQTRCIGCPPDTHPDTWWCAWEFTV
ncbi:MAG: cytosolic protein [Chloroflexi bacterium]|nr:cytosolic protein [Chloroflexota bacterium]